MQAIGNQDGLDFTADVQLCKNMLLVFPHRRHCNIQRPCYVLIRATTHEFQYLSFSLAEWLREKRLVYLF